MTRREPLSLFSSDARGARRSPRSGAVGATMADPTLLDELERRVRADPASVAFANLGEQYRRAGRFDEAIAVCRAGLEHHPGYASARVTLGRALAGVEDFDGARTELRAVLADTPDNLAALQGLADLDDLAAEVRSARAVADEFGTDPPEGDIPVAGAALDRDPAAPGGTGPATLAPLERFLGAARRRRTKARRR
ncbi:MAG: tetratricopeptide repeat protein [Vicinamibacterales bacterium]|nr:hypothetical protein [Acidobacteriota bacterium]MDP6373993.1 tetratricopeptide repeat protein [Vicinamibacterales bacterium]MDP6609667.1 tetratricopeptide repeat protein [Vicinamibacterales bacterium]HAK56117.1 hypothetical protein [Acidobacteriota bacterium]